MRRPPTPGSNESFEEVSSDDQVGHLDDRDLDDLAND